MALLEVIGGPQAGRHYELTGNETIVGRNSFCDIMLPIQSISRQHARIVCTGDGYYIEDLNSLNGTFVNGERVRGRRRLEDGDRVQIYEVQTVFRQNSVDGWTDQGGRGEAAADGPELPVVAPVPSVPERTERPEHSETIVNTLDAAAGPRVDIHAREKLQAVLEITRILGMAVSVDEVLPKILEGLFTIFPQIERGQILIAEQDGSLALRAIKQGHDKTNISGSLGPISHTIANRVMSQGEAILSADVFNEQDFQVSESVLDFPIRSMMCAPLMGPSRKPSGIMYVDTNDPENRFDEEDLEVLLSVAMVAGQAVEYAQTYEARLMLDRQQRELSLAKQVQLHFLPQHRPEVPGYRFYDHYRSAQQVGGDYYGYVPLADGSLAIAVGDVAGKGVSAALLMARLCSDVRYCLASSASPAEALRKLNCELSVPTVESHFVTFCLCLLEAQRHRLTIFNAGHMPPLCRRARDGQVETLGTDSRSIPLGIDPQQNPQPVEVRLEPGDLVVVYTDGISEAMDPAGQLYGIPRLHRLLATAGQDPAHQDPASDDVVHWGNTLIQDVNRFMDGHTQSDDICLVCLRRDAH